MLQAVPGAASAKPESFAQRVAAKMMYALKAQFDKKDTEPEKQTVAGVMIFLK